jgi:hypothetical protein
LGLELLEQKTGALALIGRLPLVVLVALVFPTRQQMMLILTPTAPLIG